MRGSIGQGPGLLPLPFDGARTVSVPGLRAMLPRDMPRQHHARQLAMPGLRMVRGLRPDVPV